MTLLWSACLALGLVVVCVVWMMLAVESAIHRLEGERVEGEDR